MKFNSEIYQKTARLIHVLPKGREKARNILFSWWNSYPSWDPWILKDGDVYRLFYLVGPRGSNIWWIQGKICGAISHDMKFWEDIGVLLDVNPDNAWESGRMLAGCTHKEDDIYYLFYSAAGEGAEIMNEGIGIATSVDGLHWQRSLTNQLVKPDNNYRWYGRFKRQMGDDEYDHYQWRDPYVVKDHQTGKYYMFICAYLKEGGEGKFRGCVGVAVADKITGPYQLLPPAAIPVIEGTNESPYYEMERPQVIYKNGQYHLFFSCWTTWLNPKWIEKVGKDQITDSSLYWYVSDCITGPFKPVSEKPVVQGSEKTGMYGTNFFPSPDNPDEFIAYGWYYKRMTLALSPLHRVCWNNHSISIN
ncbi:glycoside hydrolase family 68 protein [Iningainema tapete]|uniref:Glycoside hydrolase family 68 protein n=1 Tax=Iningainema tapete BLCC-T55 TaxID=2748662 RepID=A0A8J6XPZ3_9CYAN|nr:glycoside hydrolase family 68 protein [Iningainema tapete]MBD2776044.1 glycoside hydrolase family 68 protein [Iningainema tapete BLCC-T55]